MAVAQQDIISNASTLKTVSRRDVIKAGVLGGLLLPFMAPSPVKAAGFAIPRSSGEMKVSFQHQHTGESFSGAFKIGDRYLPEAFEQINHVLRDFRTGENFPIDPRAIDLLHAIQQKIGGQPFEILSGYRSPKTNMMLSKSKGGVAQNSLHMTGQAIDIRVRGFSTKKLSDLAASYKVGGVGYYAKSNFVHVDTGQVRRWS